MRLPFQKKGSVEVEVWGGGRMRVALGIREREKRCSRRVILAGGHVHLRTGMAQVVQKTLTSQLRIHSTISAMDLPEEWPGALGPAVDTAPLSPSSSSANGPLQCRRVSPTQGQCSGTALPRSAFCALHACPRCGAEKASTAAACPTHTGQLRQELKQELASGWSSAKGAAVQHVSSLRASGTNNGIAPEPLDGALVRTCSDSALAREDLGSSLVRGASSPNSTSLIAQVASPAAKSLVAKAGSFGAKLSRVRTG